MGRRTGVLVAASFVVMFSTRGAYSCFGVLFKEMEADLGGGRGAIAAAYSTSALVVGLLAIAAGRWTDRHGPRPVVLASGTAFAVGLALVGAVQSVWQLFIALGLLVGAGLSGAYIPVVAMTARFEGRRSLYTGVVLSGAGCGGIIGPQVANALMESFGWRTVYFVFGAFAGVAVLGAGRLLPGPLPVVAGPAVARPARTGRGPSRRTMLLGFLSLAWAAQGFVMIANTAHLQAHITDLGFSTGEAARTVGVLAAAGVLGSFVMGYAADRFGAWAAFTGGFAAALAGVTGLVFVDGLLPITVMAVVLGLGAYGIGTVLPALTADLFGLAALGAMLGLLELWWSIGAWLGPIYFGTTFDGTGTYTLAYGTAAAITAGALLLCPLLRPPRAVAAIDPVPAPDLGLPDVDRDPGGAAGARGDRPIAL